MRVTAAGLVLGTACLLGCVARPPIDSSGSSASRTSSPAPRNQALMHGNRDIIVMTAFSQVGKPYLYGGNGPDAFDCSGLVRYAYSAGGAKTPRTVAQLFTSGRAVDLDRAKPGDLLFYRLDPQRSAPSHVVFYLGDHDGIHAPSSGGSIRIVNIGIPYFSQRFAGARRLIE